MTHTTPIRMTDRTDRRPDGGSQPIPVLFDMDGVLLEGRSTLPGVYADAADAAIETLGCDVDDRQRRVLRAHPPAAELRAVCSALDVDAERFWKRKERAASRLSHERIRAGERAAQDDLSAAVAIARERPAAIVSNNRHETVRFVADRFELESAFDVVRGRDPTLEGFDRRKPDPSYLSETMDELGVTEGVYVGDRPKDVLAAARAGLDAVLLRRAHHPEEPVAGSPAAVIESLHGLERVVDAIEEG